MPNPADTHDYGRFDELAEEFAERYRRGERPSLQEYVDRFPEMAEEIRELFPALVEVEKVDDAARGEAAPTPPPGVPHLSQIGDYRILREVGRGGMGVVYEAEQISLGRRVALKLLLGQVLSDRKAQERFRREAKSAARLHHTNIVPVFEVGREKDISFYAMQLIQGQGLDQVIDELQRLREPGRKPSVAVRPEEHEEHATIYHARSAVSARLKKLELGRMAESLLTGRLVAEGPGSPGLDSPAGPDLVGTERFDPDATSDQAVSVANGGNSHAAPVVDTSGSAMLPGGRHVSEVDTSGRRQPFFRSVAQIGRQAAQGLAHAHSRGIVHRDIKPSNLLLDTDGVVWITDFGLAKADDDGMTATGDILGTLRYMAPERFRGLGDARADVYALGLTIYELLTLRPAFESSDRLRLIEKVKNEEPDRPRSIDSRIARDLETIVLKAIDKEPERRYQTAEALAEDLRRFLVDEPIKARQVSTSERYWRWARRNPAIASLGALVATLLVAATIGSLAAAAYFRDSAQRETNLARNEVLANLRSQADRKVAVKAQQDALLERDRSRQLSANLTLEKGLALGEEGHADRGLLWMLEALKTAPDQAEAFRKAVRWNLGAWLGQVHQPLRVIDTGGPYNSLGFSPDGRSFATASHPDVQEPPTSRAINLWDSASGRKLGSLPDLFTPFAFRPDGKVLVAMAEPTRLVAIDLATRQVLWTNSRLPGSGTMRLDFATDSSTILAHRLVGGTKDVFLVRLDALTGQQRGAPLGLRGRTAISPDGETVANGRVEGDESFIDLLELSSGQRVGSWRIEGVYSWALYFSPDGKSLFGSQAKGGLLNSNSYFARIWDLATRSPRGRPMRSTVRGNYVASADRIVTRGQHGNNSLVVRTASDGQILGTGLNSIYIDKDIETLGMNSNGRIMLGPSGNHVILWRISGDAEPVATGETELFESKTGIASAGQTRDLLLFRDRLATNGRVAATSVWNGARRESILLSDPATGRPLGRPALHNPGWAVRAFAFSPDGRSFATGSNPPDSRLAGEVRLWDVNTGRLLLPPMPHTNYVSTVAFQPDGKVLAAGDYHGLVRFWDTSTGREIGRPLPQGAVVVGLAYSPDGSVLAVGLSGDHGATPGTRLWDTRTNQPLGELLPSTSPISSFRFREDNRVLIAAGQESLRVWDVSRRQALSERIADETSGGFRPDGRAFLTTGIDGTVRLREVATGKVMTNLLTSTSPGQCAAFRADGSLVAAGFDDGTVRLCDPTTSRQIGPSRHMRNAVSQVVFTPDGRNIIAIDDLGESRTWPISDPMPDESIESLTRRIEARTGLHVESGLAIERLDDPRWSDRLEQMRKIDPAALSLDEGPAWHEPMVLEAERNGNTFAAIWHLDRLITARPDDWFLHARRARALSRSEKSDQAAADYQRAEQLSSRDQVLDFQTQCVVDCTRANRWAEALWYLDRLIAVCPDDSSLPEIRAAVYGKLGREADRKAELARVIDLGTDEGMAMILAQELGRAGRWAEAASLLARCGRRGSVSREMAQAWGVACLKAVDRTSFQEACAAVVAWEGPNPTVIWEALSEASLLGLGAEGIDDYRVPIDWFGKRLASSPTLPPLYRRLFSNALGGLLLRAGRFDEAIVRINEGIAAAKDLDLPTDWAYLAMAHAGKGNFAEARRCLGRIPVLPPPTSGNFWDIHEVAILQSEAESLLFDAAFPTDPFQAPSPK